MCEAGTITATSSGILINRRRFITAHHKIAGRTSLLGVNLLGASPDQSTGNLLLQGPLVAMV